MQQLHGSGTRIQLGLKGWAAIGVGFTVVLAMVLLAIGFFIFILPGLILAPVLFYFAHRPNTIPRSDNPSPLQQESQGRVIDGEFRVIDSGNDSGRPSSR